MEKTNMKINALPSPTYNWLKMNDAQVQAPLSPEEGNPMVTRSPEVKAEAVAYDEIQDIAGGMGYDMDRLMKDSGIAVLKLSVPENTEAAEPVHLDFRFEDGRELLNAVEIHAAKNAKMTVLMDFASDAAAKGFGAVQTKIRVEENAVVRLIQVQRLGSGMRFLDDIGVVTAENGRFEQIQLNVSGGSCYQGSRTDLLGARSSLKTDIGYLLRNQEQLDMNYIANHIGRKTLCEINVDGVLRNEARKLFRGTIDLRKGAKGAVGNELENVLLMNDDVVNQTIPVILCDEEDVEGNHGATIGRIDESLLFYLESRGLSHEEVYEMMAEAKLDAVINKIQDAATREYVRTLLNRNTAENED